MTNWGKALINLANNQNYDRECYQLAQSGMKQIIDDGGSVGDDDCARQFMIFAIETLFYQYQNKQIKRVQINWDLKPEYYLDFEFARDEAIKRYETNNTR